MKTSWLALSLAAACGGASTPAARRAHVSVGGKWMPRQILDQADTLRGLGLAIDPARLADPLSPVLGAVVSLGGCSASLVSPDGLIVTNHHCVQGPLQLNSTP